LALLALAFSFAFLVGAYLVDRQPILVKRHGRKAVSLFRVGLDHLRLTLLNGPYLRGEFSRCLRVLGGDVRLSRTPAKGNAYQTLAEPAVLELVPVERS
jgi:hypothetical protein